MLEYTLHPSGRFGNKTQDYYSVLKKEKKKRKDKPPVIHVSKRETVKPHTHRTFGAPGSGHGAGA